LQPSLWDSFVVNSLFSMGTRRSFKYYLKDRNA
jgi:hypothetical protein